MIDRMQSLESEKQFGYMNQMKAWVKEQSDKLGRPLTCHITTFGCQMNAKDSEKLLGILEQMGYVETEDENADFVLFNTCTVRENANLKLYGHLGHLKKKKQLNPHMMIALCGCMMQEAHVVAKIKEKYRFVDLVFGTHNIFKLAELMKQAVDSKGMIVDIWKDTEEIVEDLPSERKYSFKCGVNIMYGCNNFCSYCIVPYVRGRERSRNPKDIIREIESLVADGVVEVMLLGQNVNSYGKNLEEPMTFAQLLREIEKIEGLERIRFMTPHPKDLSDDLIDVLATSTKVCNHIHLPVQSGSTEILKKMNRHYTKESYLDLVERIRAKVPNVAFTTDIIVGFPGETEEDFLDTVDVVKKVGYDSCYTFIYSKRTGTPAADMPDQVPEDVVKDRFKRLLKVVGEASNKNVEKLVGKTMDVLVETLNDHDDTMVTGRLTNNVLVHFEGTEALIGKIVPVVLKEAKGFYYIGERAQEA